MNVNVNDNDNVNVIDNDNVNDNGDYQLGLRKVNFQYSLYTVSVLKLNWYWIKTRARVK